MMLQAPITLSNVAYVATSSQLIGIRDTASVFNVTLGKVHESLKCPRAYRGVRASARDTQYNESTCT